MSKWLENLLLASIIVLVILILANAKFKEDIEESREELSSMGFTPEVQSKIDELMNPPERVLPTLECYHDRRTTMNQPAVMCESNKRGIFYWSRKYEPGMRWLNFHVTTFPLRRSGYPFTTDPGELMIRFEDMEGNDASVYFVLDTNLILCHPQNNCLRVSQEFI